MDSKEKLTKDEKIAKIFSHIKKKCPEGANISLGTSSLDRYTFLETPFPTLNAMIRGIPAGRFTVIAGPSQVGKTALCYQIVAHAQRKDEDLIALWVDLENSHDSSWSETLGVDNSRLICLGYSNEVPHIEGVMDRVLALIDSNCIGIIVIDSIGAMLPKGDIIDKKGERSLESNNMLNLQVKLGEIFRRLNVKIAPTAEHPAIPIILLGHVYNVPTTTGATVTEVRGGNSVKHWASIRLAMRRGPRNEWPSPVSITAADGTRKEVYPGFSTRIKVEKTKVTGSEGEEISLTFSKEKGFDVLSSIVDHAIASGKIVRSGAWFSSKLFPDKVQGLENLRRLVGESPELQEKLRDEDQHCEQEDSD